MPRKVHDFDPPERFVAGTVGEPGRRTFYLQARDRDRLVTIACEKVQVAAIADRLGLLLEELKNRGVTIPAIPPATDEGDLEEPIEEAFRAAVFTIAWDTRSEEIVLEAQAPVEIGEGGEEDDADAEYADDDPDGPDLLRVRLTPTAALAFIARSRALVAAGRPPCPWCGQPLEATGHFCTRKNGNKAH
jgi:uncharacterized repeat protein (TIGR03847 family)